MAERLVVFGFQVLALHGIIATVDPENTASIRILEKVGMVREGFLLEQKQIRGKWRSSYLCATLVDKYNERIVS